MSIEIVERTPCPTCDGIRFTMDLSVGAVPLGCIACHETGIITRVLATFADAAAMRAEIRFVLNDRLGYPGMPDGEWDDIRDGLLEVLGVTDEN